MNKGLSISELPDVTLLKFFVGLRDRRQARKKDYEADDSADKDKCNKIEIEFLRRFNEQGIDRVASKEFGTAYRSTRRSVKVDDPEAFMEHIKEHEAWELIEKRPSKKAVEEYRDVHDDLPAGVSFSETQTVNVRRS